MVAIDEKIEELQSLSEIIAADSKADQEDFHEIVSDFFWQFNMKSYALFQELFLEFRKVDRFLNSLVPHQERGVELKEDDNLSRYKALWVLFKRLEEVYCTKKVVPEEVEVVPVDSKQIVQYEEALTEKNALIEKLEGELESIRSQKSQAVAAPNELLIQIETLTETNRELQAKLDLSDKHREALQDELTEIKRQQNRIESDEDQFHSTIKDLHKKIRWLEHSVLEEAIKVYQKNRDLKKSLRTQDEEHREQLSKLKTLIDENERLANEERRLQATIRTLNSKLQEFRAEPHQLSCTQIENPDEACRILGLNYEPESQSELKKVYKNLAQTWHPDKFIRYPRRYELATEIFQEINLAHDFLKSCIPT